MKKITISLIFILPLFATAQEQVIRHKAYTTYYDRGIKAPDSVSWNLTSLMVSCGKIKRVDMFAPDPLLIGGPKPSDFIQISTDPKLEGAKGHLFSFEDASCDPTNRTECFYVDQMYWQYQSFNAGDWKTVEVYERSLAAKRTIHVIAGYIGITKKLATGIPIVTYMYKAIYHDGAWECWIMPNLPTSEKHAVPFWHKTAAQLDSATGLRL